MSDDALDLSGTLVGSLPTWPTTLQNFVSLALQPGTNRAELIAAIELDPALLVGAIELLPFGAAATPWHTPLDEPLLRSLAIIWANAALAKSNSTEPATRLQPGEPNTRGGTAARQSLLAGALGGDDTSRIAGLFAGAVVDWCTTVDAVADLLSPLALPPDVRDAVRYCRLPLDQLGGLSMPIRATAAAGTLLPYLDHGGDLPADLRTSVTVLLGIPSENLYAALGSTTRQFQHVHRDHTDSLATLLQDINTSNALYRARAENNGQLPDSIRQIARLMLATDSLYHFVEREGELYCHTSDFTAEIAHTRIGCAVARAFSLGKPIARPVTEAVDVVDRQLIDRLGADCLLVIPLGSGAGVIVCGVTSSLSDKLLATTGKLQAFTDLITRLCLVKRTASTNQHETVSLAEIDREIREITHEVNNPLTTVRNYLATLSLKLGPAANVEHELRAISSELARIGRIVQKYATIGREEQLVYEVIDLNDLIGDLVAVVSEGSKANFVCHFDQMLPPMEFAADALRQVVLNLLKNASEALAGTDDGTITISTEGAINVGGHAYTDVTVTDNGPGMTAAARLALFDPAPRNGPDANPSTKGEGRGLGLSIVRQLMTSMNGIVSCRDAPNGRGTSFQLLIPIGSETQNPQTNN